MFYLLFTYANLKIAKQMISSLNVGNLQEKNMMAHRF